ncbi:unnamed protein product [Ilex paraguariensis]|uniref:RNase H type-1 domain-containing protein n=1 Tax=Ilex paraguariensis TaxID=185542 RepID=A0ABC8T639_9AQUA
MWSDVGSAPIRPEGSGLSTSRSVLLSSQRSQSSKISCDGAFKGRGAAIGVVLRNSTDCFMDGIGKRILAVSSQYAEVAAVREACLLAFATQLRLCTIESDNQEVIKLSTTEGFLPGKFLLL